MQSLNSSSINDVSYQKREREREEEGKLQILNLAHTKEKLQREAWIIFVLRQEGRRHSCGHHVMDSTLMMGGSTSW